MARFERHLFVCLNERPAGDPRGCCSARGSAAVLEALRQEVKARGLGGRVRVNQAGCLDTCASGVSVVVYPEGVWYGGVTPEDAKEIVERHVIEGTVVTRLVQKKGEAMHPPRPLEPAS